ncbi:uncharacterized protein LOC114527844 [Dendronephthya gigantea]|uniref:uncharacterized protein LOC114527844 n=1 Tax=Dendronephthya gigantea TaxID=151771 RepID=UPI00106B6317|nr:uncharacterized protein LOC114527844 [Dendronephthya gigantea]
MEPTANNKSTQDKPEHERDESSAFDEQLSKGSIALSKGDLATAELHYAAALKLVYQGENEKEMRMCFENLGNIYLEYGKMNKCGESFAKATALYNSALSRLQNTETKLRTHLISCIKESERHFLCSVLDDYSPIDFPNYDNDIKHKILLENIRDECKEIIRQVDIECDPGLMPLNPEKRTELEEKRTKLISTLFRKISDRMVNFIKMLIEECISVLGDAPCRFAVIGLGSLARNEMTPYSDLEFAILPGDYAKIESNLVYFRNITRYFHLKVINLGETILPSMCITSLNDFYSGDPKRVWFFDDGPKGFSFDGDLPWASKCPFGRKKTQTKEALELIKTPKEMAAVQCNQVAIKEGYHLADVLATPMLIMGDEELKEMYDSEVKEMLQAPSDHDMWTNGSKRGFESLSDTFQKFSVHVDWHEAGKVFNVKKELYRFPSLVLNSLTFYYNLDAHNTWDVVDEMQRKQLITESEAHHLGFVSAVASELRLRSYLEKDEQRERITGLPSGMVDLDTAKSVAEKAAPGHRNRVEKAIHIHNPDVIFRFFMTVLPLQKAIEEFLLKKSPNERNIFSGHNLYDSSPETKATIHIRLMEFEEAQSCLEGIVSQLEDDLGKEDIVETPGLFETLSVLGNVCLELGEVAKAVEYLDKAAQILEVKYKGFTANMEFAKSYSDRGNAYDSLGEYEKSLSCYQQDLSIKTAVFGENSPGIEISFSGIARAYQRMKDLEQAIYFYEKALKVFQEIDKTRVPSRYCVILNNLLSAYAEHGDIDKALDTYNELFEIITTLFGTGVIHPYLAASLTNLASAHHDSDDYKHATALYEQSLSICQRLYGRNEVHPEIASLLYNLGCCYSGLSDHDQAIKYFTEALGMQKLLYGKQISHPHIATTLSGLGSALLDKKNYMGALEAYDEALQIQRLINKDNFAHRDLCALLNNLGFVHTELGHFDKAADYLEEAHKLWIKICVDGKPHEDFASCLNNLGNVHRNLGQYKEAYEFCRRGLEMRRSLYEGKSGLKQAPLAKSFIDTGHCCVSLGDSENALSYFQRGLVMRKEINVDVAEAYNEVAGGYSRLGRPLEAIKFYKEVIRLDEEKFGVGKVPDYPMSANLCNLGSEYIATEEFGKAAEMLEKALEIMKRMNKNSVSVDLAATLHNLGTVYRNLKQSEKALSYLEEALAMKKQLYGKDRAHLETAKTLTNLGNLCIQLGRLQQAIDYFSESLRMKYALYGPNATHQSIAVTLGNIGNVYYQMGEYESAVAYIKDALQKFGDAESCNREVAINLYNLGQAYEGLADLQAACGCYEKSLKIMVQVFGESHPLVKTVLLRFVRIRSFAQLQAQASQASNSG